MSRPPLTREQLQDCVESLTYQVQGLFSYYLWMARVRPKLAEKSGNVVLLTLQNAVIEAQLMYIRKLNDFLRPPKREDDLTAGLFGYAEGGGFLQPNDVVEIHKRVAHPTTRQATDGPIWYDTYIWTHAALTAVAPVIKHLATNFYVQDSEDSNTILRMFDVFRQLWDEWSNQIESEKRLKVVF